MCGVAVAEDMGSYFFDDAGHEGVFADDGFDADAAEAAFFVVEDVFSFLAAAAVDEDGLEIVLAFFEVIFDGFGSAFGEEDDAGFVAFAADHEFASF